MSKSHTLWLAAAVAAPAAHYSGCGWFPALLAVGVVLPFLVLPANWENLSGPLALVQILWLGLLAGTVLKNAAAYWPSSNDLAVPLVLLALVLLTRSGGAPRIGAVLAFCLLLLAVPLACSAAASLEFAWLEPDLGQWPWGVLFALLLAFLPAGKRGGAFWFLPIVLAVVTQGMIGPTLLPDPFYQTGRTLGHMEPILAAGMTLAFYAMTSWMHSAAVGMMPGKGASVLFALSAGFMIWYPRAALSGLTILVCALLWILLPFLRSVWALKNNLKKDEKRY